jgi:hypothetical protein
VLRPVFSITKDTKGTKVENELLLRLAAAVHAVE